MNLAQTLRKCADKHVFFYVTLDPEKALGIEDVLPNYTVVCPYKSALVEKLKNKIDVVVLEENMPENKVEKITEGGTYGMLKDKFVQGTINERCAGFTPAHLMVLKNSELIEALCEKQGWKLLAPKARVAEKFESKISQYKALKNILPYPESRVSILENVCAEKPVVLQFNRGHSGNSTFFIGSTGSPQEKSKIEKLYKFFPKREVKISEHIKGKTYTLNCLVLKNGDTITGSISEQITGLKSATNNPSTTVGNDFNSVKNLAPKQVKAIKRIALKAGRFIYKKGFRGLFGIDVIIDTKAEKVYFIEINTHQPASISFEAKLHRSIGKIPLLAYYIMDSLSPRGVFGKKFGAPPIVLPISAKQIIYRNKTKRPINRNALLLRAAGKQYTMTSRAKTIMPNEEIYRVQSVEKRII